MRWNQTLALGGVVLLSACLQTMNSVSHDGTVFGPAKAPPSGSKFSAAYAVFSSACKNCHGEFLNYSEQDWIDNGYVVAGEPEASALFRKLRGAIPGGNGNMPKGGQLADAEIAAIRDWIAEIQPTAPVTPTPLTAAERTAKALAVISGACNTCHAKVKTASSSAYAGTKVAAFTKFTTDQEFIDAGLVVAGMESQSWLCRSLMGYGDIATMPKFSGALTQDQADTLKAWIVGIGQP